MISVGIIGLGRIGQLAHLEPLLKIKGCKVTALADLRPKLAELVSTHYGVPCVYHSHRDLLADRSIDAVVVVTHRHLTAAVVSDCLDAGKHVLAEKPLAYSTRSAQQLIDKAQKNRLVLSVGYMKRFDESLNAVKALIERQLGSARLTSANTAFRFYNYCGDIDRKDAFLMTNEPRPNAGQIDFPGWLPASLRDDYDGFLNVFSHDVNIINYLLGPGITPHQASSVAGICQYIMTSAHGLPITFETGRLQSREWHEGFHAMLPACDIDFKFAAPLDRNANSTVAVTWHQEADPQFVLPRLTSWPFETQAHEFIESIAQGRKMCTSADACSNDLETIEELYKLVSKSD